jgi:hypothetical protein
MMAGRRCFRHVDQPLEKYCKAHVNKPITSVDQIDPRKRLVAERREKSPF